jgi:hypothetical protein
LTLFGAGIGPQRISVALGHGGGWGQGISGLGWRGRLIGAASILLLAWLLIAFVTD